MADRKVYGSLNSPDTLKVLACLFEHRLDFHEFVSVDLDAGECMRRNLFFSPFGQVPVYEDDGIKQFGIFPTFCTGYPLSCTGYIRRGKPEFGFVLFESESLKWPEFDDVNGNVLTYSAQDRKLAQP
ncbi:uncharacterized protein LOC109002231 [Juglans regia]|uniref:Uncharacterized protein LOC109002231 n=1 Tax=Juglans regia TaxID=51240 RepID=A0A6P9DST4_JUGRE|nr:uncharacterized protein LOC109002231 [Juglans regia]